MGFKSTPPGPNNQTGISGEKSTKREATNHPLTKPACKPIQPHKEPLSIFRSWARTKLSKNNPINKPIEDMNSISKRK
tara:strand:- start:181 stop:414 length:234 start_codon:yes stop_codon:yes gene_type:complete